MKDLPSNLTPRAKQALALARKEADRFNHHFVGTEHLLLGIIKLGQGVAVNVLQKMGLDLEIVRIEVEKQVGTGPNKPTGDIPYTPRAENVLLLAGKEAKALNHTYVGTEHILLGLLIQGNGVAAQVLEDFNVNINLTRQTILKELDPEHQPQAQAGEGAKPAGCAKNWPTVDKWGDQFVRELNMLPQEGGPLLKNASSNSIVNFLELLIVSGFDFPGLKLNTIIEFIDPGRVTLRELDIFCEVIRRAQIAVKDLQVMYNNSSGFEEHRIGLLLQKLTGEPPRKLGPPRDWLKELKLTPVSEVPPPAAITTEAPPGPTEGVAGY